MAQAFYSPPRFGQGARVKFLALIIAILMALVLGVMLWVTQQLSNFMKTDSTVRTVDVTPPPPPDPPMVEEEEPPPDEPPPPPKLDTPPPQLSLDQLMTSLQPGTGVAMAGNFGVQTFSKADMAAEMVFKMSELDKTPKLLRRGPARYPSELRKNKVEGKVRLLLLISENGDVMVEKVLSSDHPEFTAAAKDALKKSRYEPPMREGKNVKARYVITVPFRL